MHVYMYMYVCTCGGTCAYTRTRHKYMLTHMCMYIYKYIFTQMNIYMYMHVYMESGKYRERKIERYDVFT